MGCNNAGLSEKPGKGEENLKFASGALIIGPDGKEIKRSKERTNVETMVVADLPLAEAEKNRKGKGAWAFSDMEAELFFGALVKDSQYVRPKKDK